MFRGIVINRAGKACSTDNIIHRGSSNCSDSEYDFGSVSSIDKDAATEKPPATHTARDVYGKSGRLNGKLALRSKNDTELHAANIGGLKREEAEWAETLERGDRMQINSESYDSIFFEDDDTEIEDSSMELGDEVSIIDGDSDWDKIESVDSDEEL